MSDCECVDVIGNAGLVSGGGAAPSAHASTHEDGGADEISVAGLSGELADPQPPKTHATSHSDGGADEVTVDNLAAGGTDGQVLTSDGLGACAFEDPGAPTAHASSHQDGGADEISVAGLSGVLADAQTPSSHNTSHQSGGGDAIKLDDLADPDDNTDLDSSTSKHGLLKKLGGGTTNFLRADGAWAAPPGGGGPPNVGFSAYRASGNLTVSSGVEKLVEWPNETEDPGSDFDTTNDRFQAPSTGRYVFTSNAQIQLAAAGLAELRMKVGSTIVSVQGSRSNQAETVTCNVSAVLKLTSGDYVYIYAYQNSGFNATVNNTNLDFYGAQIRAD